MTSSDENDIVEDEEQSNSSSNTSVRKLKKQKLLFAIKVYEQVVFDRLMKIKIVDKRKSALNTLAKSTSDFKLFVDYKHQSYDYIPSMSQIYELECEPTGYENPDANYDEKFGKKWAKRQSELFKLQIKEIGLEGDVESMDAMSKWLFKSIVHFLEKTQRGVF